MNEEINLEELLKRIVKPSSFLDSPHNKTNARIKKAASDIDWINKFYSGWAKEIMDQQKEDYQNCCKETMSSYRAAIDCELSKTRNLRAHMAKIKSNKESPIKHIEDEIKELENKRSKLVNNYYKNKFDFRSQDSDTQNASAVWHWLKKTIITKGHVYPESGNE